VRKRLLPTPSPSTASCSLPRSSGSLARRRRRSRRAHLRPRISADNCARRAVTVAPATVMVEKGEVVALGNVGRPVTTPASTVVVADTRPRSAGSTGVRVQPTWPKLKSKSPHYFWSMPGQCCGPKEKRAREKP
jgi:hypothetical protein